MDELETAIRRFPLVPRSRPACLPLPERVELLCSKARAAAAAGNRSSASAVFNLAALLASDCGRPDLAREWCHQHARLYLDVRPLHQQAVLQALEPLVNLARLRVRAGDGSGACEVIGSIHRAVVTRTDITIDGVLVPAGDMATTREEHREVRRWLWAVTLVTTARAHAIQGNWKAARAALDSNSGIGNRMLDGRQVAVLAEITAGRSSEAERLVAETVPGDPWEQTVTATLRALAEPSAASWDALCKAWGAMGPLRPDLAVFRTRLGMTVQAVLARAGDPRADVVGVDVLQAVLDGKDGYGARDVLSSPMTAQLLAVDEHEILQVRMEGCAFDSGMPRPQLDRLATALEAASDVIRSTAAGA